MLDILKDENELRIPSENVTEFDESLQEFCENLKDTLIKTANAAGLAAAQVGVKKNIFVGIFNSGPRIFINLKIESKKNPLIVTDEGCLSFPGQSIFTIRYNDIETSHYDEKGNRFVENFSNFGSILVQHESEHAQGILMFDHKVPEKYDPCFCGSSNKFKFCCWQKVH